MKNIALLLLLGAFLVQWFVPLNMIMQQEDILKEGTVFKFKTRPVDPNDPFRGKFVILNYEAARNETAEEQHWFRGEPVFVRIATDAQGFAKVHALEKMAPVDDDDYVQAEIDRIWGENPTRIRIKFPFERFYMEETKAPKAEALFRDMRADTSIVIYSLVVINQGKSALEDVLVNGVSIKDAVEED